MTTPPSSPPPPSIGAASRSPSTLKCTRKAIWLRSLATRLVGAERALVHVDLAIEKGNGPRRKKLKTYLGIVTRDKVNVTYENWKHVLAAQKDLIWEDIQTKFDIPEASYLRTKKKILQTVSERWRQFKYDLMSKWALAANKESVDDTASQGSFVAHGCQDVLTAAIGRLEHPSRVHSVGADVTIKQYFGLAPRTSHTSSSMAPEDLEQLTQQIRDQLEESIIEKVTRQLMLSFSQMQSQFHLQMQSQGLALPPEPEVGPLAACVSTKESCVDPSRNASDTSDLDKCRLYIEENPPPLVALERVYEGSTTVHNIPLLHDQVKVGVEEVRDADAPIPVPTEEGAVGPAKPVDRLNRDVDDPLYMMTLTIPQLFLKPLQVMHMTETSMRAGNADVYGFLKPQSIQRSGQSQFELESYIKNWMQNSKRDVYLGAYLNGAHWQIVFILPKENVVIRFCSLYNRPDNYLKGIINSALKGLGNTPQSKFKAGARWIVVKYFNDARPLEPERLKALRIQWAKYYLKVKNDT
ncbi:hypothetical protein HKD37_16G045509 [Glycine soja]